MFGIPFPDVSFPFSIPVEILIRMASALIMTSIMVLIWGKIFHIRIGVRRSVLIAFLANFLEFLLPYIFTLIYFPYIGYILPLLVWMLAIKAFVSEIDLKHTIALASACYLTALFLLPYFRTFSRKIVTVLLQNLMVNI